MRLLEITKKLPLLEPLPPSTYEIQLTEEGLVFSFVNSLDCERIFEERGLLRIIKHDLKVIVAHAHIPHFLLHLGAEPMGLTDVIEGYYLDNMQDRSFYLAKESMRLDAYALPMSDVHFESFGLGPQTAQMLGKVTIHLPETHSVEVPCVSRVVFMLDRSGSMDNHNRLIMVKQALLDALDRLPADTLVSIYFYDDELLTFTEDMPISAFSPKLRRDINDVVAGRSTYVEVAVKGLLTHLDKCGVMHNPQEFKNLTVVWLTDGEDGSVKNSDEFAHLFLKQHDGLPLLTELPRLIVMGIGSYNETLLNGVAQDHRFKTNLMLHINSPDETGRLFQVVSQNVGFIQKRVILAISVDDVITYQDLNYMKSHEHKSLIIEINLPPHKTPSMVNDIVVSLIVDEQMYRQSINLSHFPHRHIEDTVLLKSYYLQCKNRYVVAKVNAPLDAEKIRDMILQFIPSHTVDKDLRAIRHFFHTYGNNVSDKKRSLRVADMDAHHWATPAYGVAGMGLFSMPTQADYSHSLVIDYSQNP